MMSTRRVLALVIALLWAAAAMLLGAGVAYADEQGTSDKTSQTDSDTKPADEKPSQKPEAKPEGTEKPDTTTKPEKDDTQKPARAPRGTRKHGTPKQADASSATSTAKKADATTDKKTDPEPASATVKTASTAAAEKPTSASSVSVAAANVTAQAPKAATATVGPPATASAPNPVKKVVQFTQQMVGLVNDVALIAVTVINNLAAGAATAIGPKPFFGVPYHAARAVADTAAVAAKLLSGTPLDATSNGPFKVNYVGNLLAWFNPAGSPPGANDPDITVTPEHPLPIILVNATTATQNFDWSVGAPVLANAGYKVYTFNYGNTTSNPNFPIQATGDIRDSAAELAAFVEQVKQDNDVDKVILIGHSQGGGIMPAYYINNLGGDESVSQFIGIAPSNHGTDVDGLAGFTQLPVIGPIVSRVVNLFGAAWLQQAVGSALQEETYGNGDTSGDVLYTTITTRNDWVVTPYTQQALDGPNVTNIVLQDQYPYYNAGHIGIVFSAPVWDAVLGALAANPEANPLAVANAVAA